MKRNSNTNNALVRSTRRCTVKRATRTSYSIDSLSKELQDLNTDATRGEYQAQLRLEAISQLLDPCLNFCESDVRRIINKGYPPQVERGLKLYRLMSRLTILCEPIGDTVGAACRIRLINFEDLTWSRFLDIKGHTSALILRMSDKGITSERFNGLELLKPEEKDLYERIKPYFGGRRRPTLKSLALGLLAEEREVFSDRSASNHLAAVSQFRDKHRGKLAFRWAFVGGVEYYNRNPKSARESYAEIKASMSKALSGLVISGNAKAIGEAISEISEQMLKPQKWFEELAISLPKIMEQAQSASKFAASAFAGIVRMPQITLPTINFRDDVM